MVLDGDVMIRHILCIYEHECMAKYDQYSGEEISEEEKTAAKKEIIELGYAVENEGKMYLTRAGRDWYNNQY